MKEEKENYKKNLDTFIVSVNNEMLSEISFSLDQSPTFDKNKIPVSFKYAHSVQFRIAGKNYFLTTSSTSNGIEALWIGNDPVDELKITLSESSIIKETINDITAEKGYDDYYYKLTVKTYSHIWVFYAAEVYDDDHIDFLPVINEEMILAFNSIGESNKFEELINERKAKRKN